jgi:hypothetical protein
MYRFALNLIGQKVKWEAVMDNTIKIYDRCKIKGTTFFGQYLGQDNDGMVYFHDEETQKIEKVKKDKLIKAYEKY